MLISCSEKEKIVEVEVEVPADCPPSPPQRVYAVNYDGFIYICFAPNPEEDVRYYNIWASTTIDGEYEEIGYVTDNFPSSDPMEYCFEDDYPLNGEQNYYYVVAEDAGGNLSTDLTTYIMVVSATPRPEGTLTLDDVNDSPSTSGFDFSEYDNPSPQPYDQGDTDIYYTAGTVKLFTVYSPRVRIQDYGFVDYTAYGFDELNYAPDDGWSPSGTVEVIRGHVYFLKIDESGEDHYVKLWIDSATDASTTMLWAYQTDPGNRDLVPGAPGGTGESDTDDDIVKATGGDEDAVGAVEIKGFRKGRQVPPTFKGNLHAEDNL